MLQAERPGMADLAGDIDEPRRVEAALRVHPRRALAHAASRCAVVRISAIMLGTPWVRLALSWRDRSNGASRAAMSVCATSAAGRSWTAARTRATMPLVIAALLSARKCSRAVVGGRRIDPDRGRAAADLGRVGLERVGHRIELAAEVDQQPVAVVAVEQLIIVEDVVEWRQAHRPPPSRRASAPVIRRGGVPRSRAPRAGYRRSQSAPAPARGCRSSCNSGLGSMRSVASAEEGALSCRASRAPNFFFSFRTTHSSLTTARVRALKITGR